MANEHMADESKEEKTTSEKEEKPKVDPKDTVELRLIRNNDHSSKSKEPKECDNGE